jgi:hypothetical protein
MYDRTTAIQHATAWLTEWDNRGGFDNGDTEPVVGADIASPLTVGDLRALVAPPAPETRSLPAFARDGLIGYDPYAALDSNVRDQVTIQEPNA